MGTNLSISETFCWGEKQKLIEEPSLFVDRLFIKEGGFSSIHFHKLQHNQMIVLSGILWIKRYNENKEELSCLSLYPRDENVIYENEIHQFHACSDCEVIEIITPTGLDQNVSREDIIRLTERGIENAQK